MPETASVGRPIWRAASPLILASASVTRRALLDAAGLPVETEPAGIDEREIEARMGPAAAPAEIAARLARAKAVAVANRRPGRVVIGADQVIALEGRAYAKPAGAVEARDQLARFSGRTHQLHSAVALVIDGSVAAAFVETASLTFRPLGEAEIDGYVSRLPPEGWSRTGLYQVESWGVHLIAAIEGEHSTVLGLPMLPLLAALRARDLVGL